MTSRCFATISACTLSVLGMTLTACGRKDYRHKVICPSVISDQGNPDVARISTQAAKVCTDANTERRAANAKLNATQTNLAATIADKKLPAAAVKKA
jgi:hypothetical protein